MIKKWLKEGGGGWQIKRRTQGHAAPWLQVPADKDVMGDPAQGCGWDVSHSSAVPGMSKPMGHPWTLMLAQFLLKFLPQRSIRDSWDTSVRANRGTAEVFSFTLLWGVSPTTTSPVPVVPSWAKQWPEPGHSASAPLRRGRTGALSLDLSQCRGFEIRGGRERKGEAALPGQQIPPRTSKPLGFIPKHNKISLIFQQDRGRSLPADRCRGLCRASEPGGARSPLPASQKAKVHRRRLPRLKADAEDRMPGRLAAGNWVSSSFQQFDIYTCSPTSISVALGSRGGCAAQLPAASEAGERLGLMAVILAVAI